MSAKADTVRVFVASPADTARERHIVGEVVSDINRIHGRREGFRIDLLRWEEDTYPDVGADAQDVVTRQIGDYDVFIGLMATKFGSPTTRANSGTEEEFDLALEKHFRDPSSMKILFYFRDSPVRLSQIDVYQALQVHKFRQRIRTLGVLYYSYYGEEDLRRHLANHLLQAVRDKLKALSPAQPAPLTASPQSKMIHLPDWHATTKKLYPQWANYRDIPLESYTYSAFSLKGSFFSRSPYFRFGFKFLTTTGRPFGDGAIQSQDNNLLLHIGKNKGSPRLFLTTYLNGVRQARNRPFLHYSPPHEFFIEVSLTNDNVVHLNIESTELFCTHVNPAITRRLMMLAWGDENEYEVFFRSLSLHLG